MPNWCITDYTVLGPKKDIGQMAKTLSSLENRKESLLPNGFGKVWLGNIVHLLKKDWKEAYCRGEIISWERTGEECLRATVMSAWSDMPEVMRLVEEKYPECRILYRAEEPGNIYYVTNDSKGEVYPERYILEMCIDNGCVDTEYFKDLSGIAEFLKENYDVTIEGVITEESINGILKKIVQGAEEPDESFAYINKIECV